MKVEVCCTDMRKRIRDRHFSIDEKGIKMNFKDRYENFYISFCPYCGDKIECVMPDYGDCATEEDDY